MAWICPICNQMNDDDSLTHCTCGYDISDQELFEQSKKAFNTGTRTEDSKRIYLGLYLIAFYYVLEGSYKQYLIIAEIVVSEIDIDYILSSYLPIGFIASGIGLFLKKGWGRNFAMFFTLFIFLPGIRDIAVYIENQDIIDLIKGSISFFLAALIYIYLMKEKIRKLFPESPISLFILGGLLCSYSLKNDSGIALIEYFWIAMSIVGFAMILRAAQQRDKAWGVINNYINNKS